MIFEADSLTISMMPDGIRVRDGKGYIHARVGKGKITYIRTPKGGLLYHDDSKVGEHFIGNPELLTKADIQGKGNIHSIKVYDLVLTDKQVSMIGYLPLFKEGDY